MTIININEVESILEDLMPDEATAEAFGVAHSSYDKDTRIKVTSTKIFDEEEQGVSLVGTAGRFGRDFYIYQYPSS